MRINAVYSTFFGTSPPARACVAVDLPTPSRVMLDCISYDTVSPLDRRALHVQGLSHWAPANIGPYSQAVVVRKRHLSALISVFRRFHKVGKHVFVSGQIGMIPSSLALPVPQLLGRETALALQHTRRILDALKSGSGGGWHGHGMFNLFWYVDVADARAVGACTVSTRTFVRLGFIIMTRLGRCYTYPTHCRQMFTQGSTRGKASIFSHRTFGRCR